MRASPFVLGPNGLRVSPGSKVRRSQYPMPPDAAHRARAVALYTNLSAPETLAQSGVKRGMSKKKHAPGPRQKEVALYAARLFGPCSNRAYGSDDGGLRHAGFRGER